MKCHESERERWSVKFRDEQSFPSHIIASWEINQPHAPFGPSVIGKTQPLLSPTSCFNFHLPSSIFHPQLQLPVPQSSQTSISNQQRIFQLYYCKPVGKVYQENITSFIISLLSPTSLLRRDLTVSSYLPPNLFTHLPWLKLPGPPHTLTMRA